MPELSTLPPATAVLPSADSATETPCSAFPAARVPTSFGPCCVNCASASCDEKRRLAKIRTDAANNFDDLTFEIVQTRAAIAGSRWLDEIIAAAGGHPALGMWLCLAFAVSRRSAFRPHAQPETCSRSRRLPIPSRPRDPRAGPPHRRARRALGIEATTTPARSRRRPTIVAPHSALPVLLQRRREGVKVGRRPAFRRVVAHKPV